MSYSTKYDPIAQGAVRALVELYYSVKEADSYSDVDIQGELEKIIKSLRKSSEYAGDLCRAQTALERMKEVEAKATIKRLARLDRVYLTVTTMTADPFADWKVVVVPLRLGQQSFSSPHHGVDVVGRIYTLDGKRTKYSYCGDFSAIHETVPEGLELVDYEDVIVEPVKATYVPGEIRDTTKPRDNFDPFFYKE